MFGVAFAMPSVLPVHNASFADVGQRKSGSLPCRPRLPHQPAVVAALLLLLLLQRIPPTLL